MKKNLLKTMLVAVMAVMASSAWALTADLSMDYELAGYQAKAFYNLTSNADGVMPTEGDLRYREGWGLFDFGGGNRSADVAIPVAETDVLVCQFADTQGRNVTINSISGCTLSTTLSDAAGHLFFDVNATAETITINIGRAGCVVSILVMKKDESAATADYTLNYVYESTIIKSVTATGAVGGTVMTDASFFADDVKYFRAEGEPESFTIAAGENTFTVNVRLAATYSYSLTDNFGTTIDSGSYFEGETVYVGYPRYLLKEGTFYEAAATNKEYRKPITLSADDATATVEYAVKEGVNTVFFTEAEAVEGMTVSTFGNIPVRASAAVAATATEDLAITTLTPGKYKLHVGIFTSTNSFSEKSMNFGVGDETFAAVFSAVNLSEVASEEYELNATTDIKYLGTTSWGNGQFDYIWIEKTGEADPAAIALAAAKADLQAAIDEAKNIDTTDKEGVAELNDAIAAAEAAVAAADATLETIAAAKTALEEAVQAFYLANAPKYGIIWQGEVALAPDSYVTVSTIAIKGIPAKVNDTIRVTVALPLEARAVNKVITKAPEFSVVASLDAEAPLWDKVTEFGEGAQSFDFIVKETQLEALKAVDAFYIVGKELSVTKVELIDGKGTVGIATVENTRQTSNQIYNLAGQKVTKAQKGLFIINGKKVVK